MVTTNDELCPICDCPLADRGYSELVTDEYGAVVHEGCLQLSNEDRDKHLSRNVHGNLIYR
jgi:hypothetical protein